MSSREKNRKRPFRPGAVCLSLKLFKKFIYSTPPASSKDKVGHGRAPSKNRGASVTIYKETVSEAIRNVAKLYKRSTMGIGPKTSVTIDKLPDELLSNIFTRILAKQLAQMRSVSKSWNALLSESSFVKSHLHHSIHNNDQMILLAFDSEPCSFHSHSKPYTAHSYQSPHLELTHFNKLPPLNPQSGDTDDISVIGAVNGLICSSYNHDSVIHIWNPSLSATSLLPPSLLPSPSLSEIFLRFGFDPQTDDYKVVKLTGIPIQKKLLATLGTIQFPFSIKEWLQVEVYSMKKGSWVIIRARLPSHIKMLIEMDRLCVDGHHGRLHWLACCSKGGRTNFDSIACFDLGSHTFSEIRFPNSSTLNHRNYSNAVGVLAGKLCVILQGDNGAYEVWVHTSEAWVKRHVFSLPSNYTWSFGFTSHSELLFERNLISTLSFSFTSNNEFIIEENISNCRLVLYDPIANQTRVFMEYCCRRRTCPQKIVEYVDSLVWVASPRV